MPGKQKLRGGVTGVGKKRLVRTCVGEENATAADTPTSSDTSTPHAEKTLLELCRGDKALLAEMFEVSQSEDDPPLIFDWSNANLTAFVAKAAALAPGAPLPPVAFLPLPATADDMAVALLTHLRSTSPVRGSGVIGTRAGLSCTLVQFGGMVGHMGRLELHPWFVAVLATGIQLPGPLAAIYTPRPRVVTGVADLVPLACALWQ